MNMTVDMLRAILEQFEWSPRTLARVLGIHETAARKWANGRNPIPQNVADWLEVISAGPAGWRQP